MKCRICDKTIGTAELRSYVRLYRGDTDTARKVYACWPCQEAFDRWIDALPVNKDGRLLDISHAETKALLVATDRRALEMRLRQARSLLTADIRRLFGSGRFDFEKRRLVGNNGMVLQWQTRAMPDKPIGYLNQQTTEGTVASV